MAWPHPGQGKPKANAGAAVIAGFLGLVIAGMFVWFAVWNLDFVDTIGVWRSTERINVIFGFATAAFMVTASVFTVARTITGAWVLCVMSVVEALMVVVVSPLLLNVDFDAHMEFVFGFHRANGVAMAIAAAAKSYGRPFTLQPHAGQPR